MAYNWRYKGEVLLIITIGSGYIDLLSSSPAVCTNWSNSLFCLIFFLRLDFCMVSTQHYLTRACKNSPARLQVWTWRPAWRLWNGLRAVGENTIQHFLSHSRSIGRVTATCLTRKVDGFVCLDEGGLFVGLKHDLSWIRRVKLVATDSDCESVDLRTLHLGSLWQKQRKLAPMVRREP